jgi:hypothetical protein
MPRQTSAVELNKFVAGLITEASPLTFPDNASLDEQNFVLNRNGSRSRRLGMDLENGGQVITSTVSLPSDGNIAVSSFKWTNAGGNSGKTIIVVQIGSEINFFDNAFNPLSVGYTFTYTYSSDLATQRFSYAVVDGTLVVVTGKKEVDIYKYDSGNIIKSTKILYVRDLFGIQDVASST